MTTVNISVAMATYNGEKYLKQQLDTIALQTYLPCELVVCDDGSLDSTVNIVQDFSLTAPFPVRLYVNENNLGFANNFLKCASLCDGEWIAFCDQDDIWLPNKLASMKNIIDKSTKDLVLIYHAAELVNEKLESLGRVLPLIKKDSVTPVFGHSGFWFVGGCVMCFKSVLINDMNFDLRPRDNYQFNDGWSSGKYPWMPHDKWICMLANISGEIAAVAEVLSLYRRHGFALTGSHSDPTIVVRIEKSAAAGSDSYQFLSNISFETAKSFASLSNCVDGNVRKKNLAEGEKKWKRISHQFSIRSRLYDAKHVREKLYCLGILIFNRAYFGDKYTSFGLTSLLKDFAFTVGMLSFAKMFFKQK